MLVVEDEILIAMLMEDFLLELGHTVIGPMTRLETAMKAAAEEDADFGILDVNLSGQTSYPVAETLQGRNIPFVFATAYDTEGVRDDFREVGILRKPVALEDLRAVLSQAG